MTEAHRAAALDALDVIHHGLRASSPGARRESAEWVVAAARRRGGALRRPRRGVHRRRDFEPDELRLGLVVGPRGGDVGAPVESLADAGPSSTVEAVHPARPPGQDARTARYLSLLQSHVTARTPTAPCRTGWPPPWTSCFASATGIGREDAGAAGLLGPELTAVLTSPPRRLSRPEIERCTEGSRNQERSARPLRPGADPPP